MLNVWGNKGRGELDLNEAKGMKGGGKKQRNFKTPLSHCMSHWERSLDKGMADFR
jgi:hypothetical protein